MDRLNQPPSRLQHEGTLPWTLDQALPVVRQLEPVAKKLGYQLSVTGSVLWNGFGRDLDLHFTSVVASISGVTPEALANSLVHALEGDAETSPIEYSSTRQGIGSFVILWRAFQLIDCQFYVVPVKNNYDEERWRYPLDRRFP